jgi:tetratricopeptide (TPR) repeat protein
MTDALPRAPIGAMAALVVLLGTAAALQILRERIVLDAPAEVPTLWLQSPAVLDRMALEFDALAADAYWIRAVVYYGSVRRSDEPVKNYDLLYPLLEITTALDPQFLLAYRMGAIFLSEGYPGGPGRPDLAVALLEKGLRQDPNRWQLMHDIGFVYFWTIRDYKTASSWLERASEVPGAPVWLKTVAAGMSVRGGDRQTARLMWQELLKSDADFLADTARQRLAQLDALDQIEALHSLIARVTLATGRRPTAWSDLVARGWLRDEPRDPAGFPYVMDPATGQVTVSRESLLYPLPTDLAIPRS